MGTKRVAEGIGVRDDLALADLGRALAMGWADFRAKPAYGLFFAAIFVAVGITLYQAFVARGEARWLIAAIAGFPLLAPFAAVGMYEVSRRRELDIPLSWSAVLGALNGRGDQQLLLMGGVLFVGFSFWVIIAHMVFAIFAASAGLGEGTVFLRSPTGLMMLGVGSVVGAGIAYLFYAISVMSLPMLVDRDVDFITAIITSVAALRANMGVLMMWAVMVAISVFAAILPMFLGLFIVLPVLGHASWHLYRSTVVGAAG